MLWLAGLMGLMAVGAAAYIEVDEDVEPTEDHPPRETAEKPQGNLLDTVNLTDSETLPDSAEPQVLDKTMADAPAPSPDWITAGTDKPITDFHPEAESLLFVWDDSMGDDDAPEVEVAPDPDHVGHLQVRMGDQVIARVSGDMPLLEPAEIALIPLSSAEALGFAES